MSGVRMMGGLKKCDKRSDNDKVERVGQDQALGTSRLGNLEDIPRCLPLTDSC